MNHYKWINSNRKLINSNRLINKFLSSKLAIALQYTAFIACALLILVGCGRLGSDAAKVSSQVWEDVAYTPVDTSTIDNEELLAWIDENHREQGIYIFDQQTSLGKYVLIAAGERTTGGYTLHIDQMKSSIDEIKIKMSVTEPKKGEFVTQGFAYPYVVVQIHENGRKIVLEK